MLSINLEYDINAAVAPRSFRDAVQAAANRLEATIATPITANIVVGYGEYGLGTLSFIPLTSDFSEGGVDRTIPVSYPVLRNALATTDTSLAALQAIAALPNATSLNGKSTFQIAPALAKALGLAPGNGGAVDGEIGFPVNFTGNDLVGTAVVEELHALGLLNDGGDLGLFSYTSPGVHFFPNGPTATTAAYFSLDGGKTSLANYAVSADDTLFSGLPNDALNFPYQGGALTPLDLMEIGAIGYAITGVPAVTPAPPVAATPASNPTPVGAGAIDPATIAINAAGVFGFANVGAPGFSAVVNQDGNADVAKGASALTGAFIGGLVAGTEIRVMANLEQSGGSTAQIVGQFARDLDTISTLLTAGSVDEGFGFLTGLTAGGPTGLTGGKVPPALQSDIQVALGSDQQAVRGLAGCIVGAVNFAQGYVNNINAGQSAIPALRGIEASALL